MRLAFNMLNFSGIIIGVIISLTIIIFFAFRLLLGVNEAGF